MTLACTGAILVTSKAFWHIIHNLLERKYRSILKTLIHFLSGKIKTVKREYSVLVVLNFVAWKQATLGA